VPTKSKPVPKRRRASGRISLVLIDDNPTAGGEVLSRIRAQPGFRVLAVCSEVEAALKQVRTIRPEVVLLNLPEANDECLTLAGALHGEVPASRVIVMGAIALSTNIARFIRSGVSGFTMADAPFDTLLGTIQEVAAGSPVLPLELTGGLFGQLRDADRDAPAPRLIHFSSLTAREQAVANLIMAGFSNRKIAHQLQIALYTVKSHVHNVLLKLDLNTRLEVATFSRNRETRSQRSHRMAGSAAPTPR
jgi:two-component system, NarL family, nitrate/nitrite response regulator NarL